MAKKGNPFGKPPVKAPAKGKPKGKKGKKMKTFPGLVIGS